MLYINAGHEAPLIYSAEGALKGSLPPCGPVVGIIPDATYSSQKVVIEKNHSLVLYADGLTDSRNGQGKEYTFDRLKKLCGNPV